MKRRRGVAASSLPVGAAIEDGADGLVGVVSLVRGIDKQLSERTTHELVDERNGLC